MSSSVTLFSFCLQSFPASGSFSMSHPFASDGQTIGASALVPVLPKSIQGLFPLIAWFDLFVFQGTLKCLFYHHSLKASIHRCSAFFTVQLSELYITTGKTIALTIWTFVGKVMSLLFNTLSRFVITFLPRSKGLLISLLILCINYITNENILYNRKLYLMHCGDLGRKSKKETVFVYVWLVHFAVQ